MNPYALVRNWVDACLAGPSAMSRADIPVVLPIGVLGILIFSVSRDAAAIVIFGIAASAWRLASRQSGLTQTRPSREATQITNTKMAREVLPNLGP